MSWVDQDTKDAITSGLIRFYTGIGRTSTDKAISLRTDYIAGYFDGYSPQKIKEFFEWLATTFTKFIPDGELKTLIFEKRNVNLSKNASGESYYGLSGAKIRRGTFYTIGSATTSEWHFLPSKAKELSIKAKHDLLIGEEMAQWREMCERKFPVKQGKTQKPREEWSQEDYQVYGQYLDWNEKDWKYWDEYEKKLIGIKTEKVDGTTKQIVDKVVRGVS